VKRYLRQGDVYVHADVVGAASCVIRNKGRPGSGRLISPVALQEAGASAAEGGSGWEGVDRDEDVWRIRMMTTGVVPPW
jgi:predicted ribosome quality control (RQC) complex YloA/Tae2 family protein